MEDSTQQLVQRALTGDRSAVRRLFAQVICPAVERRLSYRLARRAADHTELRDYVQEVFVHLLERDAAVLRRWDPERGALEAYVAKVAENVMLSRLRKRPPPRPTDELDQQVAEGSQPGDSAAFSGLVRRLLADLSESDAHLFRAVYLEELSPEEAAAQLGVTREAAYKRIQRLRDKVAGMMSNLDSAAT